jgi:hypothetical protein
MERDLTSLLKIRRFYLRFTKLLLRGRSHLYDGLFEAIRDSYHSPTDYSVVGVGVWEATNEGIQYLSGDVGIDQFYPFTINDGKKDEDKILVVDSYLTSKEQVVKLQSSISNTYLVCFPISKHVISVHLEGRGHLSPDQLTEVLDANAELIRSIEEVLR